MIFAFDSNEVRIKPSYSGQKAKCLICQGVLIGKCGQIYNWHWQHQHDRDCDTWKDNETEWHRNWKSKFPEDWQEVIIEYEGEKHIADIKTSDGIVIEFQNSSISKSTIRIRENFYQNMIWVVNAKQFKDNLKINSVVSSWLRRIEKDASHEITLLQNLYKEDLKAIDEEIKRNINDTNDCFNSINYKVESKEKLNQVLSKKEEFANLIIENYCKGETFSNNRNNEINYRIRSESKLQLQEFIKEIKSLKTELITYESRLSEILNLENFLINKMSYKIVPYEQILPASFDKVIAISKESRKTFFPEFIEFKSELEFKKIQYLKVHYDFAVDPTSVIYSYKVKIVSGNISIVNLENSLKLLTTEIARELIFQLENKIQELEIEIERLNSKWDDLIKQKSKLSEKKARVLANRNIDIHESEMEIERKKNDKKFKVMKEKKGLYGFDWKYPRKSWNEATKTIYFDIGETYLFKLVREDLFKKIPIDEFLKQHLEFRHQ